MIELSYQSINRDWHGEAVEPTLEVGLALANDHIVFGGRRQTPAVNVDGSKAAEFYEGLWEADCVELFLGTQGSEKYLEVNLAPNGSWAIFIFSSYRKRIKILNDYKPKIFSQVNEDSWASQISIEKDLLESRFHNSIERSGGGVEFLYNITAVLKDSQKLSYLTLEPPTQSEPDFHLNNLRKLKL